MAYSLNILDFKSMISLDLMNYYNKIKYDLDKDVKSKLSDYSTDDILREMIINLNRKICIKINKAIELNMLELNQFFTSNTSSLKSNDKEHMKMLIIKSFCYYLPNITLNSNLQQNNGIGMFISTDWYLDCNQINYINLLFCDKSFLFDSLKFDYDQNILLLKYSCFNYLNNEYLLKNLNNQLILKKSEIWPKLAKIDIFSVELEGNRIEKLKNHTFKPFKHIVKLTLNDFKFSLVENLAFAGLGHLKILVIDSQPPYFLPFDFDYFGSEEKLNGNLILKPIELLKNLNELYLHNFIITQPFFNTFHSLAVLDLSYCDINKLDNLFFAQISNLRVLNLKCCKIFEIQCNSFCNLSKLEILNLRFNKINHLNETVFNGLSNLKLLNLSHNNLNDIKIGSFRYLINLEELDLSNSCIEKLDDGFFHGISNLKRLNLSYNTCLKEANSHIFNELKYINKLNVDNCLIKEKLKDLFYFNKM